MLWTFTLTQKTPAYVADAVSVAVLSSRGMSALRAFPRASLMFLYIVETVVWKRRQGVDYCLAVRHRLLPWRQDGLSLTAANSGLTGVQHV